MDLQAVRSEGMNFDPCAFPTLSKSKPQSGCYKGRKLLIVVLKFAQGAGFKKVWSFAYEMIKLMSVELVKLPTTELCTLVGR
jgi:hypothetical protein